MSALASATTHTVIERTGVVVRHARVADAPAIAHLIASWADRGLTIRRSLGDILSGLGDFSVAVLPPARPAGQVGPRGAGRNWEASGGEVVACASLEVYAPGKAEVRSVSVAAGHEGLGAGRAVVNRLLEEARARGIEDVVLLTKSPAFFERCRFRVIPESELCSAFLDQQIAARGRTLAGRNAMRWMPE